MPTPLSPVVSTLMYYAPPAIGMAFLTFAVLFVLGWRRLSGIRRGDYQMRYFKLMQRSEGTELPAAAEAASRNVINLFEVPVLFYALVPLAVLSGVEDATLRGFLWAFVLFRALHSLVHLTVNHLVIRFAVHLFANLAILGAWVCFALLVTS